MIAMAVLALVSGMSDSAATFSTGNWEGRCARVEDSRCVEYEAVNQGPATLRFRRNASGIFIVIEADGCTGLPRTVAVNPDYSAPTMTHLIRGHVIMALAGCQSKAPIPAVLQEDIAELLRQTSDVAD